MQKFFNHAILELLSLKEAIKRWINLIKYVEMLEL